MSSYLEYVELISGQPSTDVLAAVQSERARIEQGLRERGAVLLRGYAASDANTAAETLRLLGGELLDDAFWSTPRSGVTGKTFTATDYPKARTIALHNEMAYMTGWPRFLAFHSIDVADQGGETSLANLDDVSRALGPILDTFAEKGVTYRRTYRAGIDIPWQKAFRTDDPKEVDQVAAKNGMSAHWLPDDVLQTAHTAQGAVKGEHGQWLWFNQAHMFHASNVPEQHRKMLTEMFGADQLPRNATYGDGTPIPDAVVKQIHEVLVQHTLPVAWQPADVLVFDNMRFMHGRLPFEGTRKLHVAMSTGQTEPTRTPVFA